MESKEEEIIGTEPMEREEDEDIWKKTIRAVHKLYTARDKISESQSVHCLNLLDSIPLDQRKSPLRRATYEYLKGKILGVVPDYSKEAEDHLVGASLCLGHYLWKKGYLPAAKNCLNLVLSKRPDKMILQGLSMLERRMAKDTEKPEEVIEESIQRAKDAIALDVEDMSSWYILGNAYMASFVMSWDLSKLQQFSNAYWNAEKYGRKRTNPAVSFRCGIVNKYLENYERALSGFEAAALMDPSLNADAKVRKMVNLLDKIDSLLKLINFCIVESGMKKMRKKRLAPLASSVTVRPSHKKATVDVLSEGPNKAVATLVKVLFFIKHGTARPLYYIVCDSNQTCFIVTVYCVHKDAIKEGDQLLLFDPFYRHVDFSWKEKHYNFRSIRVDFREKLLVNGKAVSPHHAVRSSIFEPRKPYTEPREPYTVVKGACSDRYHTVLRRAKIRIAVPTPALKSNAVAPVRVALRRRRAVPRHLVRSLQPNWRKNIKNALIFYPFQG